MSSVPSEMISSEIFLKGGEWQCGAPGAATGLEVHSMSLFIAELASVAAGGYAWEYEDSIPMYSNRPLGIFDPRFVVTPSATRANKRKYYFLLLGVTIDTAEYLRYMKSAVKDKISCEVDNEIEDIERVIQEFHSGSPGRQRGYEKP
jgi:hypothetical protein